MAKSPGDALLALAIQRFGTLSEAEKRMFRGAAEGRTAVCGGTEDDAAAKNDPAHGGEWGPDRTIDGEKIRWLCATPEAKALVTPSGIAVLGARITDPQLHGYKPGFQLWFEQCSMQGTLGLRDAEVPLLGLPGTWTQGVEASRIRAGALLLRDGFRCDGELDVDGATIAGDLDLREATLLNRPLPNEPDTGIAIFAEALQVQGNVLLRSADIQGLVWANGASIGGGFTFQNATLQNPAIDQNDNSGVCVRAERLRASTMTFDGARADAAVDLYSTQISGVLNASFAAIPALDLRQANVGAFIDAGSVSWPPKLNLDGFTYGRIAAPPPTANERLKWLERDAYFSPQPYRQLAKILKDVVGDEDGAHDVLIAMERKRRREKEGSSLLRNARSLVVEHTTGYGYAPARSIPWLLGLSALGWIVYRRSYLAGQITPADKDAYSEFQKTGMPPAYYPGFSPLVYSIENSFPLVKLGQGDKWRPDPQTEAQPPPFATLSKTRLWPRRLSGVERCLAALGLRPNIGSTRPTGRVATLGTSARFARWFLWVQILIGWLLATLVVAGVAGLLRKE